MKIVMKFFQYLKSKFSKDNVSVITLSNGLSVFIYNHKVMVGTATWKHELDSNQSETIKSILKSSKSDAMNTAFKYYHDYCNSYVSC